MNQRWTRLMRIEFILTPFLLCLVALAPSCSTPVPNGRDRVAALPERWRPLGGSYCRTRNKEALNCLEFLLATMPKEDVQGLGTGLMSENIEYALKARHEFPWCRRLPEDLFLNEVLPYAVLDERRDAWRRDLYTRFSPLLKQCGSTREAILAVQSNIVRVTGVKYDTTRRAVNQSPAESMEQGKATCTGLSILLVDACRAVGIPTRLAGVLTWSDLSDNHNWVEVYFDGRWRFTEYGGTGFDRGWLLERLVNVDGSDRRLAVFATSWKPAEDWFPLAWKTDASKLVGWPVSKDVPGINVTARYQQLAREVLADDLKRRVNKAAVRIIVQDAGGKRVAAHVTAVSDASQKTEAAATSPGQTDDLNHHLDLYLAPNQDYSIHAELDGRSTSEHIHVAAPAATPQTVKLVL
jgi:hypothetical protein